MHSFPKRALANTHSKSEIILQVCAYEMFRYNIKVTMCLTIRVSPLFSVSVSICLSLSLSVCLSLTHTTHTLNQKQTEECGLLGFHEGDELINEAWTAHDHKRARAILLPSDTLTPNIS